MAHPACAADAVDVGRDVVGHVVVNHMANICNVEAARSHIGGHEHAHVSRFKSVQRHFSLGLCKVAVDHARRNIVSHQQNRDLGSRLFALREHDGLLVVGHEELEQDCGFWVLKLADKDDALFYGLGWVSMAMDWYVLL